MKHVSVFVGIAFLAGLDIGLYARGVAVAAPRQKDAHAADLAAIEKLHKADEQCTLSQDPACLTALWSEDGIKVDVPGGPVMGTISKEENGGCHGRDRHGSRGESGCG